MIKLYKTYNKAKDVFKKPKLHWKFGFWRDDHCLPVWRRGPILKFYKGSALANPKCYEIKDRVLICTGERKTHYADGTPYKYKSYDWTPKHKLPGNLKSGDIIWTRKYRKKYKFVRAQLQLPIWLSFYIFNWDIFWKTKWTAYDIRYEFPPQFTIVFFGLSLSFWLYPELKLDTDSDMNYWECLLSYLYGKYPYDLEQTIISKGIWRQTSQEGVKRFFGFSKSYLNPKYYDVYDKTTELMKELKSDNDEL